MPNFSVFITTDTQKFTPPERKAYQKLLNDFRLIPGPGRVVLSLECVASMGGFEDIPTGMLMVQEEICISPSYATVFLMHGNEKLNANGMIKKAKSMMCPQTFGRSPFYYVLNCVDNSCRVARLLVYGGKSQILGKVELMPFQVNVAQKICDHVAMFSARLQERQERDMIGRYMKETAIE